MKAFFLTMSILIMTLISCNKTDEIDISSAVVGTWKLTEVLADPGDGSGTFYTVSSNKNLIFESNGIITSNGSICDMSIGSNISSSGTYSKTNTTISSVNCQNSNIKYELTGNTLILIYPCFEPCKAKYIKVPK